MYTFKSTAIFFVSILFSIMVNAQKANAPKQPPAPESSNNNYSKSYVEKGLKENLNSKEVTGIYDVSKMATVVIENSDRGIQVKTWDQPKVKVVTTVFFEGEGSSVTDAEWLEKLNIIAKSSPSFFRIKSGSVGGGSYVVNGQSYGWSWSGGGNIAVFSGDGKNIGSRSGNRVVTIYVPKENKLEVESRYASVNIASNINQLKLDITNGSAELNDVNNLILRSKYSSVTIGNIKTGELEFINGRLSINSIEEMDIDTKYSTLDINTIKKATFHSTNDEYEFEEVGVLEGSKNYGNLRISKLLQSIDISGTNADIKIRNIDATVNSIKVDNKYADLRLPLKNIKNYAVDVKGGYNSVHGDKSIVTENIKDDAYTASAGTGKGTPVVIKCQNCTIDFK
jgi:hypothetical protein